MVTQGNGGKIYPAQSGFTPEPLIFVEVVVTGFDFDADLVADPTNSVDTLAAVGSNLEILTEYISTFGTIIAITVDGTAFKAIVDYSSAFSEPETCQTVFDYLTNELGWATSRVGAYLSCVPAGPGQPY